MDIDAECSKLRRVMPPLRILPGGRKPSSVLSRPTVRNGSWAHLEGGKYCTRQVPPARERVCSKQRHTRHDRPGRSRAHRSLLCFRLEAGRSLPTEKLGCLRTLTSKRAQLVEMRKRIIAQMRLPASLGNWIASQDGRWRRITSTDIIAFALPMAGGRPS